MIKENYQLINKFNDDISFDIRFNDNTERKPLLFFLHGFKSFKDWGFIPYTCEYFAQRNFITVNFDFSLNGIVDTEKPWFDGEIFSRQTISRHISDFKELYNIVMYLFESKEFKFRWNGQIFAVGHSMGGAIVNLTLPELHFNKICAWASISKLDRTTERQKQIWKERGTAEVTITGTGQVLPLNYSYIDDKEKYFDDNSILNSLRNFKGDYLVIHAENDLISKKSEAVELYEAANSNQKGNLIVIEHTGHTFGISHPMTKPSEALEKVLKITEEFLV